MAPLKIVFSIAGLIAILILPARAQSNAGIYNVLDFGAAGDGVHNDASSIQKTIDVAASAGGGQIILPGGHTFLTGTLTLKSGVDFHLARSAILKGSPRWQDYGSNGALLFAKDATGLTISGDGVLDGNDKAVWQNLADEEAGGDINKSGWWPQSFCGFWWPFGPRCR